MSIHRRFAPIGVRFEPEQVAAFTGIYRYIVSWEISTSLELAFSGEALKAALRRGLPEYFNIGQGSQFASKEFTSIIKALRRFEWVSIKLGDERKNTFSTGVGFNGAMVCE